MVLLALRLPHSDAATAGHTYSYALQGSQVVQAQDLFFTQKPNEGIFFRHVILHHVRLQIKDIKGYYTP